MLNSLKPNFLTSLHRFLLLFHFSWKCCTEENIRCVVFNRKKRRIFNCVLHIYCSYTHNHCIVKYSSFILWPPKVYSLRQLFQVASLYAHPWVFMPFSYSLLVWYTRWDVYSNQEWKCLQEHIMHASIWQGMLCAAQWLL